MHVVALTCRKEDLDVESFAKATDLVKTFGWTLCSQDDAGAGAIAKRDIDDQTTICVIHEHLKTKNKRSSGVALSGQDA
eukprot:1102801-Amphidinium_carterae.1